MLSWITGLMCHNYDAVGFLPDTAVRRYLDAGQYILQLDNRGQRVGYILHGKPTPGGVLVVYQHCIDVDARLRGYGQEAFDVLLERAGQANCRAIKVRCAADLPSNQFWSQMGLEATNTIYPGNKRQRAINIMIKDLYPTLWR